MSSWLQPLINEITKLFLAQKAIATLLEQNNQSQTLTNSLLKEQNELLKKYLEKQGVNSELSQKQKQ